MEYTPEAAPLSTEVARALDKFYTPPDLVRFCMGEIRRHIALDNKTLYLEPSAGDGAFFNFLPEAQRIGIDIAPEGPGIVPGDFLAWRPDCQRQRFVTVGNPPFSGGLALRFFNHAALFSSHIAMILPASFSRDGTLNKIDRQFHLVHESTLKHAKFHLCAVPQKVPTVFQIWERRDELRPLAVRKKTHSDFLIVSSIDEADLVLRRVGARAGEVVVANDSGVHGTGVSKNSNFYIRAVGVPASELLATFRACDFTHARFKGIQPSINRADIVAAYEAAMPADYPVG